jgi:hypothetical protein
MKQVRMVNLVVMLALLLVLSYLRAPVFADSCSAPGVVGQGGSEQTAITDCENYGSTHCSGMCQTACGTDAWTRPAICDQTYQGGSGWTAIGYCRCGYWPD